MNCTQKEKLCPACKTVKPASEYGTPKKHTRSYGVYYYLPAHCLECAKTRSARMRAAEPEKVLAWNRKAQAKRVASNRARAEVQAYWAKRAATAAYEVDGIEVRQCSKCGETKQVAAFRTYIRTDGARKPTATCKVCTNARVAAWCKSNPDASANLRAAAARRETPERAKAKASYSRAKSAGTHTQEDAFYVEARRLTDLTGVAHEVDHVIPLNPRSKTVCGLHIEANLRVLPAAKNLEKGSRIRAEDAEMFAPLPASAVAPQIICA